MIVIALLSAAAAIAEPRPGDRTRSPEQMQAEFAIPAGQEDLAEALAAAAAQPLGTLANPVRVGGPEGERAYIARLRCPGGAAPAVGPRREAGVGAFGTVVAAYALDCGKRPLRSRPGHVSRGASRGPCPGRPRHSPLVPNPIRGR